MYGTQPITFEWTKNGNKLFTDRTSNIKLESTEKFSLLTINRLTGIDSGAYTCIARNVYGYDLTSTKLHVQCKFNTSSSLFCCNLKMIVFQSCSPHLLFASSINFKLI